MAARKRDSDRCVSCGSDSLFSGYFDADDLALDPADLPGAKAPEGCRYTTFCNDCGTEQP